MPTTKLRQTVEIARPVSEVFDFVVDAGNDALWQTTVVESVQSPAGPVTPGTRITQTRRFLGLRFQTVWEITRREPPEISEANLVGGPLMGHGTYTFEAVDGGTAFTLELIGDLSGGARFFKLGQPVFTRMARRELATYCEHLKDLMEARRSSAGRRSRGR